MSSTDSGSVMWLPQADQHLLEDTLGKWKNFGFSTAPTDHAEAEAAAIEAYKAAGLEPPRHFIWLQSPWAGNTAMKLLYSDVDWPATLNTGQVDVWDKVWQQSLKFVGDEVGPDTWKAVRRNIRQAADKKIIEKHGVLIEKQVKDVFSENLGIYIWKYLRQMAGAAVYKQIRATAEEKVKEAVENKLSPVVRDQIYHELVKPLHQQVWSYVAEPLKQMVPSMSGVLAGLQKWDGGYGQHDSGWLCYYDFVREIAVEGTEPLDGLTKLAQTAGWWWPFENICILSERPVELHRDNRTRLHNETGMCMKFRDGWGIYAWHGVLVPAYVVLLPEPLTFDLIEAEPNAEVRRVLIERYGLDNYLREGRVIKIHQDQCGILYRMNLASDEPILVVRVQNSTPEPDGTIKEYFLRVPPNMMRARQAVAWTFGLSEEEYMPLVET